MQVGSSWVQLGPVGSRWVPLARVAFANCKRDIVMLVFAQHRALYLALGLPLVNEELTKHLASSAHSAYTTTQSDGASSQRVSVKHLASSAHSAYTTTQGDGASSQRVSVTLVSVILLVLQLKLKLKCSKYLTISHYSATVLRIT